MEQITILVENKEKVNILSTLLKALDFVKSVQIDTVEPDTQNTEGADIDFFSLAGIWQDREIDLNSLRKQAWPRQP